MLKSFGFGIVKHCHNCKYLDFLNDNPICKLAKHYEGGYYVEFEYLKYPETGDFIDLEELRCYVCSRHEFK